MPSRREFLGTGALVALGATASRPLAAEPLASRQQALALPPAIAALSSQKERMVPITNDERRARIEQARRLMGNQGLDAIVLTGGTSLRYFTNMSWGLSERLLAVILPREGAPFIVCPAFERDRAEEQISEGPLAGSGAEVMTWHEHESPYALVAQGLRARQTATGAVGIERPAVCDPPLGHAGDRGMSQHQESGGTGPDAACLGGDLEGVQGRL
jgi:Xaa-Pro dipeptidase